MAARLSLRETYGAVTAVVQELSGAYAMGVDDADTMVHMAPQRLSGARDARTARRRMSCPGLGAGPLADTLGPEVP